MNSIAGDRPENINFLHPLRTDAHLCSNDDDFHHRLDCAEQNSSSSDDDSGECGHSQFCGYRHLNAGGSLAAEGILMEKMAHLRDSDDDDADDIGTLDLEKSIDPGVFRYNKRFFVIGLPSFFLILLMTGEMMVIAVSAGAMVLIFLAQVKGMSKRCVIVFMLFFIPCHIYIFGSIFPLMWLSYWNLLLLLIVNFFCILTGGWILIQFLAFRVEETHISTVIERLLFLLYPLLSCALVSWMLTAIVVVPAAPFIFTLLWFSCMQLCLPPAVSSFVLCPGVGVCDGDVLPLSYAVRIVAVFVSCGPVLHTILTVLAPVSFGLYSFTFLVLLLMNGCVGIFLASLLGIKHLCDYLGIPVCRLVQVRWVSGAMLMGLSYPALHLLKVRSYYLFTLPLMAAAFIGITLTLSLRKPKVFSMALMAGQVVLMSCWIYQLPWHLTYFFLGFIPLHVVHMFLVLNCVWCLLLIYTSWNASGRLFDFLLLLQSAVFTLCQILLYSRDLYSTSVFTAVGIVAAYAIHRLFLARKMHKFTATASSAVHLVNTALVVLLCLSVGRRSSGSTLVTFRVDTYFPSLLFVSALLWMFVYDTRDFVSDKQAIFHLTVLLSTLGVCWKSVLLPLAWIILWSDMSSADIIGIWFAVSGLITLFYGLLHSKQELIFEETVKFSIVFAGVSATVFLFQPNVSLSWVTVFEWSLVGSVMSIASVLVSRIGISLGPSLVAAAVSGICPGFYFSRLLYGTDLTPVHAVLVILLVCMMLVITVIIVKVTFFSGKIEMFFKLGFHSLMLMPLVVVFVDMISLPQPESFWHYPAFKLILCAMVFVAVALRRLYSKQLASLPTAGHGKTSMFSFTMLGNIATVSAFLLAVALGPEHNIFLQDVWSCMTSMLLVLLQRDGYILRNLSYNNCTTPTIVASIIILTTSSLRQSRLWTFSSISGAVFGLLEVSAVVTSLPVYVVLAGVMWNGHIWSEKAVVFTLPLNVYITIFASSYSAWALAVVGLVSGLGLMLLKLPFLPYNCEYMQR